MSRFGDIVPPTITPLIHSRPAVPSSNIFPSTYIELASGKSGQRQPVAGTQAYVLGSFTTKGMVTQMKFLWPELSYEDHWCPHFVMPIKSCNTIVTVNQTFI